MIRLVYRFLKIIFALAPPVVLMIRDYYQSLHVGEVFDWHSPRRRKRARMLVDRLAKLGPTFIKLAQVLAARADLFPGVYLDELKKLHDQVPPMSARRMRRQFHAATGKRPDDVFEEFDPEPVASASLGQVHRASYMGEPVAVKILKPGIRTTVSQDIRVLARVFSLATLFFRNNQLDSLIAVYEQFSRTIHMEMDLVREAEHIAYFRRRYENDDRIAIPRVYTELSNGDVLVMEFLEGTKITDVDRLREAGHDTGRIIELLLRIFGEQMLEDGVFHADPHPGNIFVNDKGQIVLLDFGLVLEISEEQRSRYIKAVLAVVRRDYDQLVSLAFDLHMVSPDVNQLVLRQALKRLMDVRFRDDLGPLEFQRIVMQIMDVFYEFPVQLPGELVYIFKTATLIEGIGAIYYPGYNLPKFGMPILKELIQPELDEIHIEDQIYEKVVKEIGEARDLYEHTKLVMQLAAREEFAVRIYRGDLAELENIAGYMVRRLIALALMFGAGLSGAVIFLATMNWWVLIGGAAASFAGTMLLLLMPNVPKTPRMIYPNLGAGQQQFGNGESASKGSTREP